MSLRAGAAACTSQQPALRRCRGSTHDDSALCMTQVRVINVMLAPQVVATGGLSFAHLGTTGVGLQLLKGLGHTVVEPYPALTPLRGGHPGSASLAGQAQAFALPCCSYEGSSASVVCMCLSVLMHVTAILCTVREAHRLHQMLVGTRNIVQCKCTPCVCFVLKHTAYCNIRSRLSDWQSAAMCTSIVLAAVCLGDQELGSKTDTNRVHAHKSMQRLLRASSTAHTASDCKALV